MAEQGDVLTNLDSDAASAGNGADTLPVAGLLTQYVKDLSVENPKAPESFQWTDQPQIDVQFNIAARKINEEVHEIELKISVTNKTAQGTAYIVELSYCGLVGMRNMSDEQKHAFTYAEAPRILFPFARRIVGDAVRDAGFAPLLLDPVDFNGLYVQQLQAQAQQAEQNAPVGEA
ncbi:protein-export chaperone SecB [Altererythrobacter sp. Root672]|uniref:protein-export chaperone SecB n=1 Tax=Altererythrobacter sp. Root672 TaxID=1736584 RepID=UPI0006F2EA01|nr:protein-export chaperone SecB [Altererythrobacter sp. Root672]KRA81271.1 preprotein translocase subunit SecB [Altererythrobacter sp. Root672]